MHIQSLCHMREFAKTLPVGVTVLDVGARAVDEHTSYRSMFKHCLYTGLDVTDGPNVDVVVKDPYKWPEVPSNSFDAVISGQCLEHVEYPWETMREIARVVKPGGQVFIIVPHKWPLHYFPIDCWRFNPDGMDALGKWAGLDFEGADIHEINHVEADIVATYRRPNGTNETIGES